MSATPQYINVSRGLLVLAVICFVLVAFGVAIPVVNLGWIGLAFFAGAFLLR